MFHRVLVPLDSSPLSDKVLAAALRCTDPDGELVVLRIQAEPASLDNEECRAHLDVVERETQAVLRRATEAALTDGSAHGAVRAEVRSGPLAHTILETATELESDLIVMGTHGPKSLAEKFTGSLTDKVASKSSASVFVVKAAGYPFLQD